MLNNRTVGRRQGRQPLLKEWLGISQLVVRTALCIPRSVYSFLSPSLPSSSLNCLISTYKILLFCFCFFFFIFSPVPLWMDSEQVAVRRLTACWVKPQRHPSGDTRVRGFKRPHMHIESLLINTLLTGFLGFLYWLLIFGLQHFCNIVLFFSPFSSFQSTVVALIQLCNSPNQMNETRNRHRGRLLS